MLPKDYPHQCRTLVITCIDFRFRSSIRKWLLEKENLDGDFDLISVAGACKDLAGDESGPPGRYILNQVLLSKKLHHVKEVILINHQNCGAYGDRVVSGSAEELAIHRADLEKAKSLICQASPDLTVRACFVKLDGVVSEIK